jgi:hypothetical protein
MAFGSNTFSKSMRAFMTSPFVESFKYKTQERALL